MKFRPLHDRVVVKRIDPEEKSAGGIPGRLSTRASALLGIGFDPGSDTLRRYTQAGSELMPKGQTHESRGSTSRAG
jgi:hypothetical protein